MFVIVFDSFLVLYLAPIINATRHMNKVLTNFVYHKYEYGKCLERMNFEILIQISCIRCHCTAFVLLHRK